MLIKVSQKADKKRALKHDREKGGYCDVPSHKGSLSADAVTNNYRNSFRKDEDWKPGRVTNEFRKNYDKIDWN